MEDHARRDSALSFQSCLNDSSHADSEDEQKAAPIVLTNIPPNPQWSAEDHQAMRLHALLEWILDIRWTYSPSLDEYAKAYAENPHSKSLDSLREGRCATCEYPATSTTRKLSQMTPEANVVPISVMTGRRGEEDSDVPCRSWLSFDNVSEIISHIVGQTLSRARTNLMTNLGTIYTRATKHTLSKQLRIQRILNHLPDIDAQLAELQDCIINYTCLPLVCPDFYPNIAPLTHDEFGVGLFYSVFSPAGAAFLPRVLDALDDEQHKKGVAIHLIDKIFAELYGRRLFDLRSQAVTVLNMVIANPYLANELVMRPYWLPTAKNKTPGWSLMRKTLLGRLFLVTPIDGVLQGDERPDFLCGTDKFLRPLIVPGGSSALNPASAQQHLRSSHMSVIKSLAELIKSLVRDGGQVRDKTLQWFGAVLEANNSQASLQHRHMQQAIASFSRPMEGLLYSTRGLSLNGFGFNVCWVLLELCQPIALEKIVRLIDPLWPLSCCEAEDGDLLGMSIKSESTFLEEAKSLTKGKALMANSRDAKFTTQIFWLTMKAVRVLLFQCVADSELRHHLLGKIVRGAPEPPGVSRESLINDCLGWNTVLMNEAFINTYAHMVELVSGLLLSVAFNYNADGLPVSLQEDTLCKMPLLKQLNVTTSMIPACSEPSPQFALLPSSYFCDFYETFSKFLFAGASPLFAASYEVNPVVENCMYESNCELFAASIIFILRDPGTFIRNAGFKAEAAGHNLTAISVTKRFADRIAQTCAYHNALAGAIIVSFSQAQKLSYYLRIDMRLILTRELQRHLDGKTFKQQMDSISKNDPTGYERFLHFFASNTSWVLEEALTLLSEIKSKEGVARDPSLAQASTTEALRDRQRDRAATATSPTRAQRSEEEEANRLAEELEGNRNVSEMPLEELVSQCKSLMEAGSISLDAFSRFDSRAFKFIVESEVLLPQVVLYLNSCLNSLVGPKCLNLKVSNFEVYNFKPREFLACLCRIYVGLMKEDDIDHKVFDAVTKEERYFKPELFTKAVHIVRREGLVDGRTLDDFSAFSTTLAETFKHNQSMEALIVQSAPDEFMDPILSELMRDPVKLPSSGVIVDRKTIERHLISEEFDPFNRAPLKKEDLIPQDDLKKRIQQFLSEAAQGSS